MTKKKIVYISLMHFSLRIEKDWFIADLIEAGCDVEYWDVATLLFGQLKEQYTYDQHYVKKITSYRQFEESLKDYQQDKNDYVIVVNQDPRFFTLFKLLAKYGCKQHFIHWGTMPSPSAKNRTRITGLLFNPFTLMTMAYNKIKSLVYFRLKIIKPFDVVFAAGNVALGMYTKKTELIPINLIDYEKYVDAKLSGERYIESEYAVFCDINVPYQSDLKIMGLPFIDADKYFSSLNNFFDQIEKKYTVSVVIAEHPKANYDKNIFNGRMIFKNLTAQLIKDSRFIISHHSTSVSYAVLNKKPIFFIYTDDMLTYYKHNAIAYTDSLAAALNATIQNIDQIKNENELVYNNCDINLYDKFKYNYLTSKESETRSTKRIFVDFFVGNKN